MRKLNADYIFPISSPPVKNGILLVDDDGKILDLINPELLDYSIENIEKHEGVICPGFVNTHCHLELSYMKNKIAPHSGLADFITHVEDEKKSANKITIIEAIQDAEQMMMKNGIVAVGDIANTDDSFDIKNKSTIAFHTFIEVYGSNPANAVNYFNHALSLFNKIKSNTKNNSASIIPHAPYSVSPELFQKIKQHITENNSILSIHNQECEDENKFFLTGEGKIADVIKRFVADISHLKPFGKRPLQTISKFFPHENHLQLVHNTFTNAEDIDFAETNFKNLWWCFCPNANLFIENKLPQIPLFLNNKITIGTDSLASNHTLSILEEIKTISGYFPEIPLYQLLQWATLNGAEFLKINNNYGSFEKGKRPGINLICNIDLKKLKITSESKILVLDK